MKTHLFITLLILHSVYKNVIVLGVLYVFVLVAQIPCVYFYPLHVMNLNALQQMNKPVAWLSWLERRHTCLVEQLEKAPLSPTTRYYYVSPGIESLIYTILYNGFPPTSLAHVVDQNKIKKTVIIIFYF